MSHPKRSIGTFLTVAALTLIGCASSGGGGNDGGPAGTDNGLGTIQMEVWNRSSETVTVFARWGNAPRVRLGNLSRNRRGSYVAFIQGPLVGISWDVQSGRAPPPTGALTPSITNNSVGPQCGVDVENGDHIEWRISQNGFGCTYTRMESAGFN